MSKSFIFSEGYLSSPWHVSACRASPRCFMHTVPISLKIGNREALCRQRKTQLRLSSTRALRCRFRKTSFAHVIVSFPVTVLTFGVITSVCGFLAMCDLRMSLGRHSSTRRSTFRGERG
ncbi:unnamed protein product, partial [Hapterophycus canaliculatus]